MWPRYAPDVYFQLFVLAIFRIFLVFICRRFLYQMNRCIIQFLILLTVLLAGFGIISIMKSFIDNANGQTKWTLTRESLLSLRLSAPIQFRLSLVNNIKPDHQPKTVASCAPRLCVKSTPSSKPRAIEHLAADLNSYSAAVAVITETHFKKN